MTTYILEHEGKPYLKVFEDISAIPRGSFNEQAVSDYIVRFAERKKLWYVRDEKNNVFIKKPATPGYEAHEPVILQGHMDMVCEKTPESNHDFEKDPLQLYVEDGWLRAKDTTLGADDGVAVAYILAILDDDSLSHPALECVINIAEEPGIFGALAFDASQLTAKKFIGLDGCTEGTSTIITSGVVGGSFFRRVSREEKTGKAYKIVIGGLSAGHGAGNIGKEQANALKAMGRILHYVKGAGEFRIASIKGGTIRNAIAEECEAIICIPEEMEEKAYKVVAHVFEQEKSEHRLSDPKMWMKFEPADADSVLDAKSTDAVIDFLYIMPTGTYMRSVVYNGLPIASRNMGTIGSVSDPEGERIEISYMFRCVNFGQLADLCEHGKTLAGMLEYTFEEQCRYSGYEIKPMSPLYNVYAEVYKDLSGKELQMETVHYGTDAGTYAERIPGLDIIVISPVIQNVHTPGERMDLASFDRAYGYLKEVLRRL